MRHLQRCTTSRRNVRYSTHAFVDESICESGFSSFFCALSACNSLAYTSDKIDSMSMDRRPSTLCRADAATFFFFPSEADGKKAKPNMCLLGFPDLVQPKCTQYAGIKTKPDYSSLSLQRSASQFWTATKQNPNKKKLDRPLTRKVSCTRFHGHSDGLFQT